MRVDFLGLEAFFAIADPASFHPAAAHHNHSQTALSHRMKKLEEDLGVKLLARTTRQVSLTPAGVELLPVARRIISDITTTFEEMRQRGATRQNQLSIACLPTLATNFLPQILKQFEPQYPDVLLRIHDHSAGEIVEHVQAGTAEFGITIVSAARYDLEITPLATEDFLLVCAEDHPIAARPAVTWADIEGLPLVRVGPQTGNRLVIDEALGSRRDQMAWRYEVQHIATAVSLVQAGLALAILPAFAVTVGHVSGLARLPLRNPSVSRNIGLLARMGVPLSPAAQELKSIVLRHFRGGAAAGGHRRARG